MVRRARIRRKNRCRWADRCRVSRWDKAPSPRRRGDALRNAEKDPDSLFVFRHSAAHLLAAAVMELYPNVKLGIGPPIDTGFFYEFLRDEPFTPEDLAKIEKKMHELAAQDLPNERKLIPKPEALDLYKKSNQVFKCELVEEKASEPMVSFYTTGKFIDF